MPLGQLNLPGGHSSSQFSSSELSLQSSIPLQTDVKEIQPKFLHWYTAGGQTLWGHSNSSEPSL